VKLLYLGRCEQPILSSAPVQAQSSDGYLTDSPGNPVRSDSGECWHTSAWREGSRFASANRRRLPDPSPRIEAPAPVVEAPPTPAPAPVPQDVPFRVSMDTFFNFDQATLRPEGKATLSRTWRAGWQ
jgi:OOP family OmpA-OmpF porin